MNPNPRLLNIVLSSENTTDPVALIQTLLWIKKSMYYTIGTPVERLQRCIKKQRASHIYTYASCILVYL